MTRRFKNRHKQKMSVKKTRMVGGGECDSIQCQFIRYIFYKSCCCCCLKSTKKDYEEIAIRQRKRIENLQEEIHVLRGIILEQSSLIQAIETKKPKF